MASTKIEWTESTWNPVTGCSKVSPGCKNCYAERMSKRLKAMGQKNYRNGFKLTLHEHVLEMPLKWKKPQTIFVNSMSDLFHEDVPFEFIQKIFQVMREASHHTFQVLTKRSERLAELHNKIDWPDNVWMGVSVETEDYLYRMDHLRETNAFVKFVSMEPLLSEIQNINFQNIDWIIVGGESGPHSRPMDPDWVRDIRNQCLDADVPFFFKQWGGVNKKKNGRTLDHRIWDQTPDVCLKIALFCPYSRKA